MHDDKKVHCLFAKHFSKKYNVIFFYYDHKFRQYLIQPVNCIRVSDYTNYKILYSTKY